MWILVFLLYSLFPAGICAVTTATGYKGHSVQIKCSYASGYETNMKYFCRGKCLWGSKDIPVQSGSAASDQRFSLEDNTVARVFTITITDVRGEEGGTYWCGIRKSYLLPDVYTEVLLLVKTDPTNTTTTTTTTTTISHSTNSSSAPSVQTQSTDLSSFITTGCREVHSTTSSSALTHRPSVTPGTLLSTKISPVYITGGLVIMAIALLVAMLVLYKHKKKDKPSKATVEMTPLNTMPANRRVNTPPEIPSTDDCIYQEIDEQEQGPAMEFTINTIYSTVEGPTDVPVCSTIDEPTTIYCTTTLP
ncbi:uncharacterized protein [Salminus brasiliensis]|uniref:uncharacterized protein isoform X1 n=1 Tax=Salminus brasiliensis TaxID=930266 RepID=UPI003B82C909